MIDLSQSSITSVWLFDTQSVKLHKSLARKIGSHQSSAAFPSHLTQLLPEEPHKTDERERWDVKFSIFHTLTHMNTSHTHTSLRHTTFPINTQNFALSSFGNRATDCLPALETPCPLTISLPWCSRKRWTAAHYQPHELHSPAELFAGQLPVHNYAFSSAVVRFSVYRRRKMLPCIRCESRGIAGWNLRTRRGRRELRFGVGMRYTAHQQQE